MKEAEKLYNLNPEQFVFDDREKVRNGEKFADAELMGIPYRVIVSDKTLENDQVEILSRKTGKSELLTTKEFISKIPKVLK
jgi:prolyl-tRNA synthetase